MQDRFQECCRERVAFTISIGNGGQFRSGRPVTPGHVSAHPGHWWSCRSRGVPGGELAGDGVLRKRPGIMAAILFGWVFLPVQAERRVGLAVAWQSCYLPHT
ncbi:MAG: hypothetical protein QF405_03520 [Roseibacillus sp.]|nr:hypothetical protein [Roseibacillus sp.]MDP7306686.1 hypothetical protein [Roseibacillus sp.]MDP7656016.1 hypothetical protein [Roseibacillus sp.]HJM62520.1 hypothetical protein [Roseibacillus sp.]